MHPCWNILWTPAKCFNGKLGLLSVTSANDFYLSISMCKAIIAVCHSQAWKWQTCEDKGTENIDKDNKKDLYLYKKVKYLLVFSTSPRFNHQWTQGRKYLTAIIITFYKHVCYKTERMQVMKNFKGLFIHGAGWVVLVFCTLTMIK